MCMTSRKAATPSAGGARSAGEVRQNSREPLHHQDNDSSVTYADIMTLNPRPVDTPENVYANANQEQPDVVYSELAAKQPWWHRLLLSVRFTNKKAEPSQRWPRDAPYIHCMAALKNFGSSWLRPRLLFPTFYFNRLLFRSILWICTQHLKFVALPVPDIMGVLKKFGSPWNTPTRPFLPNFLMGFCSDGPWEYTGLRY